jgi:hypothetical protein
MNRICRLARRMRPSTVASHVRQVVSEVIDNMNKIDAHVLLGMPTTRAEYRRRVHL